MRRTCPLDPAPELAELRVRDPISKVTLWDGSTPWLLTRFDDARTVLADHRFSADESNPGYPFRTPASRERSRSGRSFIAMDGPEHARYRRMVLSHFTHRRMESIRPLIERTVHELLDEMAAGPRPVDLIAAFALPIPSLAICHLLGVPPESQEFFHKKSVALLDTAAAPGEVAAARQELHGFLLELVERKATDPGDDVIGRLLRDQVARGELNHHDAATMAMLLLVAGHDTTAAMIGLSTLVLLRNPNATDQLRAADPAVTASAVEELLRLLTIAHNGRRRVATEDAVIGGVLIKKGEGVIAVTEAANRDPVVFPEPDRLDLTRKPNHHLAFGFGVHQCLGQPLARLELQIALPALMRRFPGLRLATDFERLEFREEMSVYQLATLPVTW